MEYISVEEFLKQSKEIQNVFLKWWKPSIGDIFAWKDGETKNHNSTDVIANQKQCQIVTQDLYREVRIPLFTEGHLRSFIEDKTSGLIQVKTSQRVSNEDKYYKLYVKLLNSDLWATDDIECTNLLQAYWKLALKIAKEEITND